MKADPTLFPGTSPSNLAEGIASLHDPTQWHMVPGAVSMARRPSQALRTWRATPEAVQEMMRAGSVKIAFMKLRLGVKKWGVILRLISQRYI